MKSHGSGKFTIESFKHFGKSVVIEEGVLIFHPENITIEDDVYIGHQTILKGYFKGDLKIGSGSWIGQQCFIHSAGNIKIGKNVGIGPCTKIITSYHESELNSKPILHNQIIFESVIIEDDSDIGIGSIILPGVKIGKGAQVGAGSVVTKSVEAYSVVAGSPARLLRYRK